MPAQPRQSPPTWSTSELRSARAEAGRLFRQQRREEGPRAFADLYHELEPGVRAAFEATNDLRNLTGEVLMRDPAMWQVLRYFCAPPVSEEDLWTLVDRIFRVVPRELADDTALAIREVLDPVRFPWLAEGRGPSPAERDAAALATTALLTVETLRTRRRGQSSTKQEQEVCAALAGAGFEPMAIRGQLTVLDQLPRGHFSRECKLAGVKCDVPVRLHDGRLLALECKVSNGPKNSWKRLIREVGGKASGWRQRFGEQVLTGAVLAGVFDLSCLENAQRLDGVSLFWQHDLAPLVSFVGSAR